MILQNRVVTVLIGFSIATACNGSPEASARTQEVSRHVEQARGGRSTTIRQDACAQLGSLGDTTAVSALIAMLEDVQLEWCAARSLGQLRVRRAAPALRAHLRLQTGMINRMAVLALAEIGDTAAVRSLDSLQRQLAAEYALDSATVESARTKLRRVR
jgi:HEAT repeat protein